MANIRAWFSRVAGFFGGRDDDRDLTDRTAARSCRCGPGRFHQRSGGARVLCGRRSDRPANSAGPIDGAGTALADDRGSGGRRPSSRPRRAGQDRDVRDWPVRRHGIHRTTHPRGGRPNGDRCSSVRRPRAIGVQGMKLVGAGLAIGAAGDACRTRRRTTQRLALETVT